MPSFSMLGHNVVFNCLVWTALHSPVSGKSACFSSVEIVHLQDASGSFGYWLDHMTHFASQLTSRLEAAFDAYKYAVAGFVDKPIPLRGWGRYANNQWVDDYCYLLASPLSDNFRDIEEGFRYLNGFLGSGGDTPENVLEALLYAAMDKNVGWSNSASAEGPSRQRLALIMTDDLFHEAGDAQAGIDQWNEPRAWFDPVWSEGGWGSYAYAKELHEQFGESNNLTEYAEMAGLLRLDDLNLDMTEDETVRLQQLMEQFGPYPFPSVVEHPGDDSLPCGATDYPSLTQVSRILRETGVTPVIILKPAPYGGNITWTTHYYEHKLRLMGIQSPVVRQFSDMDDTIEVIVNALLSAQDCSGPTFNPSPGSEHTHQGPKPSSELTVTHREESTSRALNSETTREPEFSEISISVTSVGSGTISLLTSTTGGEKSTTTILLSETEEVSEVSHDTTREGEETSESVLTTDTETDMEASMPKTLNSDTTLESEISEVSISVTNTDISSISSLSMTTDGEISTTTIFLSETEATATDDSFLSETEGGAEITDPLTSESRTESSIETTDSLVSEFGGGEGTTDFCVFETEEDITTDDSSLSETEGEVEITNPLTSKPRTEGSLETTDSLFSEFSGGEGTTDSFVSETKEGITTDDSSILETEGEVEVTDPLTSEFGTEDSVETTDSLVSEFSGAEGTGSESTDYFSSESEEVVVPPPVLPTLSGYATHPEYVPTYPGSIHTTPFAAGGGSSVGTIVGATVGTAAGLAAAVAAYMKFGTTFFPSAPNFYSEGVTQVEVPDVQGDREVMEEINMDLFM